MNIFKVLLFFVFVINFSFKGFSQEMPEDENVSAGENITGEIDDTGQTLPLLEIKRLEADEPVYSIELRDVGLADFFRVIAHEYGLNFLVDEELKGKVTASLTNVPLNEALELIAEMNNVALIKRGNIIQVKDNLKTQVFCLKHALVQEILGSDSESLKALGSSEGTESEFSGTAQEDGGKKGSIYSLLSSKGQVLLGLKPNSFMVIDYPKNINRVQEFIDMLDTRMTKKLFKLKYIDVKDLVGISSSGASDSGEDMSSEGTEDPSEESLE